jgi:hypothetical protein
MENKNINEIIDDIEPPKKPCKMAPQRIDPIYDIEELISSVNWLFSNYDYPSYQCIALCQKTPEEREIVWGNKMLISLSRSKHWMESNLSKCKRYIEILNKIKNKEEIPFFDMNRFIKEFMRVLLLRKYKRFLNFMIKTDKDKEKIKKLLYNVELKKKINAFCEYYNIDDELTPPQYQNYIENEKEYLYYLAEKLRNPKLQKYFK